MDTPPNSLKMLPNQGLAHKATILTLLALAWYPSYVQGISDRVKRTLQHFKIKTAFKPIRTLASVFKKPRDRLSEEKIAGTVYRVECKDCDFSYIGESKRCWASRRVEHDPARAASKESAIRQHAERTTQDIHPRYG